MGVPFIFLKNHQFYIRNLYNGRFYCKANLFLLKVCNYFYIPLKVSPFSTIADPLIHSSDYVICLDSLAATAASQSCDQSHDPPHSLTVHVSKPPKEGSKAAVMLDLLNKV